MRLTLTLLFHNCAILRSVTILLSLDMWASMKCDKFGSHQRDCDKLNNQLATHVHSSCSSSNDSILFWLIGRNWMMQLRNLHYHEQIWEMSSNWSKAPFGWIELSEYSQCCCLWIFWLPFFLSSSTVSSSIRQSERDMISAAILCLILLTQSPLGLSRACWSINDRMRIDIEFLLDNESALYADAIIEGNLW